MVYMLLGTGFEETEAIAPLDLLRRANIEVMTAGIGSDHITGGHGPTVKTDITVDQIDLTSLDMVILPGGLGGVASISGSKEALDVIRFSHSNGKFLAAICAGPTVLAKLGLMDGIKATCYPGCEDQMAGAVMIPDAPCVTDGKIITGTSAGCAIPFGLMLVEALKGQECADAIAQQIVIR